MFGWCEHVSPDLRASGGREPGTDLSFVDWIDWLDDLPGEGAAARTVEPGSVLAFAFYWADFNWLY